uniref:Protein kinase domain-containing protein n=1 Tax=Panagrolaimus sp. JU765 TaxID=591449 RepID=A0AC34QGJ2_9BILA
MLHDVGYVHRHLKPSSFMLGPPNSISKSRLIFLADFQIAKRFLKFAKNKVGIFREERDPEKIKLRGYVSWIYILAELLGCLPWQNVRVDPAKLLALKMTVSDSVLFSEVKNKEVKTHLVSIPEYVRTVHWESRPDYAGIYKRLKNAMNAIGCKFSDPYEWESNCDQISDGFMPEQEYLKYFNHEEMIIVRKGDAKFDNLESSAKDEDSPRIQRKVVCDCESDSLEVCSYVEPDATQYSESGKTPPQSSAPEKSKQEIEEKQKAKSKPNEKQEKSAQKLDPSPVTADSKKSFKVKTPTAASPAKKKEPEVLSDAKEDKKPTRNPPTKEESTKRKKRAIPTPPKKTPKKDESAKKGKKRAKNPDLTVDKTRDCTRDESIDKEETKSENDCSPAKNTPKTVTKKRVSKSTNAAQNIVQKKKNESREASPVAPTPTTKKEKKKKPSKK